jgi:hypothetical protein
VNTEELRVCLILEPSGVEHGFIPLAHVCSKTIRIYDAMEE